MEGWLTKRGHIFKTWKRRWFVLDESQGFVLNYYQKEDKQTLKGTYAITGMSSVSPVSDEGSHRNAILLHAAGSGGRELLMSADSPEVALQWTAALRAMIAQCRDADDTQSPLGRSPAGESNAATSTLPKHGLSLAGFRNFVTVCGGETELFNLTTAEVAETFVKRLTKAGEWSYCSKLAAERSAHVGVATHFIRFLDTCAAIYSHFESQPEALLWFDVFSNNQHLAPSLDFHWWSTTFQSAIEQFGNTVVVFSPWNDPVPLTRVWCLFEIYCSASSDCTLEVAMCARDVDDFLTKISRDGEEYFKMLCNIDVRKSESSNPRDKQMIFEAVEKTIGFDNINKMISAKMQRWMTLALEKNLSHDDAETSIKRKIALAEVLRLQGSLLSALDLYREALVWNEQLDGSSLEWVAAACYNGIGQVYDLRGKHKESLEYYQKSLEKRMSINEDVGSLYNNMAVVYANQGEDDLAMEYYEKSLQLMMSRLGPNHSDVAACYNNMALVYANQDKNREALVLYEKAMRIEISIHGDRHPNVGGAYCNIAGVHDSLLDFDQALQCYNRALQIFIPTLGETHPSVGGVYFNVAMVYASRGDLDKVLDSYLKALHIFIAIYGENHSCIGDIYMNIGSVRANQGNCDQALSDFEKALSIFTGTGQESCKVGGIYNSIAMIYYSQERFHDALKYFEKYLEIQIPVCGVNNIDVGCTYSIIGSVYQYMSKIDTALEKYLCAIHVFTSMNEPGHPEAVKLYKRVMTIYSDMGNAKKALEYESLNSIYT